MRLCRNCPTDSSRQAKPLVTMASPKGVRLSVCAGKCDGKQLADMRASGWGAVE